MPLAVSRAAASSASVIMSIIVHTKTASHVATKCLMLVFAAVIPTPTQAYMRCVPVCVCAWVYAHACGRNGPALAQTRTRTSHRYAILLERSHRKLAKFVISTSCLATGEGG